MKFEKNPDKQYRSAPFWSLNGKLDEQELKAQIAVLKEMGFGGAFIHSRTGLATEYMSEEWLRLVKVCCETMQAQGMDAWLYDEDRWPSGTCGGYVTQNPKFRRSFISAHFCDREDFDLTPYGAEYLGSFAVRLVGEAYTERSHDMPRYSGMRLADYFPVTHASRIPDGYIAMVLCIEAAAPNEFYNGYTYVDTMAKEPTELYLKLTHEKYAQAMGEMFGGAVKGIFTDEPHRGAAFNGFGITNRNGYAMLPYTPRLFDEYTTRWNEKLEDKLPELYFGTQDDNFSRTSWRYFEVVQSLFLRNFVRPIHQWCKSHNMIFTGHMLHENTLSAQTTMSGSAMRFYEHMDYPGIDNLGTDDTCYPAALAVASAAKQLGKKFVLSELYGCTGWKTTLEEYKQIGDWQALLGISFRCPHLSWYTMKGEAKRDYPASIHKQANWHREYRAVEDYFARLTKVLCESKPITETLMISPVESAWGLAHMGGYYDCFAVRDPDYKKLEADFWDLTASLLYAGVDFDYGDEEIMQRKTKVGVDARGAYLAVGKMKYREVILPAMWTVRASTLAFLQAFTQAGGTVRVLESLPSRIDGVRAEVRLPQAVVCGREELAASAGKTCALRADIESDVRFIRKCKQAGKDEYVCFIVNDERTRGGHAKISFDGTFGVEQFDLRSGDTVGLSVSQEDGCTVVEYDFAPSQELLLHLTKKKTAALPVARAGETVVLPDAPVVYRLDRPNALVLDRAAAYVDGEYFCEDEILRIDGYLRDKYEMTHRTGIMVQPWYKEKFGKGGGRPVCRLTLEFAFEAEEIPADAQLMAEGYGSYRITLNDRPLSAAPIPSPVDMCFSCVALPSELFVRGRNVLRVEYGFSDSTDLEAFYLLGSFGVQVGNPCRIVRLADTLRFGDVTTQGLPFYAGDVTYLLPCADGTYDVTVTDFYAACLKSGKEVSAFAPYVLTAQASGGVLELTATLTPKNLFGPLHEVPAMRSICGPVDFHTSGENWSDAYALIPQGIFAPPVLKKVREQS